MSRPRTVASIKERATRTPRPEQERREPSRAGSRTSRETEKRKKEETGARARRRSVELRGKIFSLDYAWRYNRRAFDAFAADF